MTFAGIVVAQVGNVLVSRTNKLSVFKTKLMSNKWIWVGIASQLSILSIIIYIPYVQNVFGTTGIGLIDWVFLFSLAGILIFAEEMRKLLARRFSHI